MTNTSFRLRPVCDYLGMKWKGQNLTEVNNFLARLPACMKLADTPVVSVSDRRVLMIKGYRTSGKEDTIYLNPHDYLISSFSEIDGTFVLMALCVEEFEACFKRGRAVSVRPKNVDPVKCVGSSEDRVYRADGSILVTAPEPGHYGCNGCYLASIDCDQEYPDGTKVFPCQDTDRTDGKDCIWVLSQERWK